MMKVTPEHLTTLSKCILPLDTGALRDDYRTGNFTRCNDVDDLNKRYRWDLFYMAMRGEHRQTLFDLLDTGLYYDTHLDTALRSFVPPL